jgi:preprotein translocase subunit SecB
MNPVCQLEDFSLTKLHVDFHSTNEDQLEVNKARSHFDYDVGQHPENPNLFRMDLRVDYHEENDSGQAIGHAVKTEIIGFFSFNNADDKENLSLLVRLNGVSILYGLLRGMVANATGVFPAGKCILPTIMPRDVVESVEKAKGRAKHPKPAKKSTKRKKEQVTKT